MPLSIQANIVSVGIPNVRPYGWLPRVGIGGGATHGHEFDFKVEIGFVITNSIGGGPTLVFDETQLGWHERIRWYDLVLPVEVNREWYFLREDNVNFADAEHRGGTKTVKCGWFGGSFDPGWWEPWTLRAWCDAAEQLVEGDNPISEYAKLTTDDQRKQAVASYFASQKRNLSTIITDRPGLTKRCSVDDGTWIKSGGGGLPTVNRHSRRRVVHFRPCVGARFATATQILETVEGEPTINKFVIPGLTLAESENLQLLELYRSELNRQNVDVFNTNRGMQ